jgi:hypothetical protein
MDHNPTAAPWAGSSGASTFEGTAFWAGLEGVTTAERHELLPGLFVEPCYGTVFAHPILAVNPPPRTGAAHPAPWFACRGGHRNIEVRCQLHLPGGTQPFYGNRVASAWLAAAALRLLLCAPIRIAVLSDIPFVTLSGSGELQPTLISMEQAGSYTLTAELDVTGCMDGWRSLLSALIVAMEDERFSRAFSYLDAAWWVGSSAAFLVSLWTSLEALLLDPNTVGIKRALAARISELLATSPTERDRMFNKVLDLYRTRCDSAHEALHPDLAAVQESARLAGAVFFAKAGSAIGEKW